LKYNVDGSIHVIESIILNNKGLVIEISMKGSDGILFFKVIKKYDYYENLIQEDHYSPDGSLSQPYTYAYEFDDKKNWIKRIQYLDNTPHQIVERTIEYYN